MNRFVLAAFLAVLTSPTLAASVTTHFGIDLSGDAERKTVSYDCGRQPGIDVTYVNAEPNYLAIVPVNGHDRVFVNVISASGAKYESGSYVWWNKGRDVTLSDIAEGLDAAPILMCSEKPASP